MPSDGVAIAAGLRRILADSFVLRFIAQAVLWRIDPETQDGVAALLQRLILLLDDAARACAMRMRVLGEEAPITLQELLRLSSCRPSDVAEPSALLGDVAYSALQVANDFNTMAVIARESGDEVTAHLLISRSGALEEAVWRLARLAPRDHQGDGAVGAAP